MDLNDALIVTGLGIAVVFSGLILTSLMIWTFPLFSRLADTFKRKSTQSETQPESPVSSGKPPVKVTPDIVAVISAVVEVEARIRRASAGGKFTFIRER